MYTFSQRLVRRGVWKGYVLCYYVCCNAGHDPLLSVFSAREILATSGTLDVSQAFLKYIHETCYNIHPKHAIVQYHNAFIPLG